MRIPKCHRTKGFGEGLQNHFPNPFFKIMLIALAQLLEKSVFGAACQSFLSLRASAHTGVAMTPLFFKHQFVCLRTLDDKRI